MLDPLALTCGCEVGRGVDVLGDHEVPAGMPRWCHAVGVVPVVVAGLALLAGGGDDPLVVLGWGIGAFWVTEALARWVLRRQGHLRVVSQRWVAREFERPWLTVLLAAYVVWVFVDSLQTALSPAGSWWSWVLVVLAGALLAFGAAGAYDALSRRRRRRAS